MLKNKVRQKLSDDGYTTVDKVGHYWIVLLKSSAICSLLLVIEFKILIAMKIFHIITIKLSMNYSCINYQLHAPHVLRFKSYMLVLKFRKSRLAKLSIDIEFVQNSCFFSELQFLNVFLQTITIIPYGFDTKRFDIPASLRTIL